MAWASLPDFQLSLRAAIGAAAVVAIARALNLEFPIYALISAVIVTDLSSVETRKLGPARMAATILGAGLGAIINFIVPWSPLKIALGVFAAMFASRAIGLRDSKVAAYVCGIVLLDHGASPWSYAVLRTIETALGIGVAILISFLPRLIHDDAEKS